MDNNLNGALFDASQSLANGNAQGQMGGTVMPNETSGSIGVTASDILTSFSAKQKKDKEVSLSTLSQKEIKKIMKSVDSGWALAKKYYDDTVEPEVTKRTNIYNADEETYKKKFPYLSEQTKWRSRDVQTAAEWLLPGLVEAFVGGSKPVDVKGVNVDDDLKAKKIEQIISYQVERKNSLHAIMKFSIEEALRSNFGIAKLHWKHEEKREKFEFVMPNDDIETAYVLQEAEMKGEIEITSVKPLDEAPDLLMVKYDKISVTANYPVIEFLSPYEVRFTPEASTFQTTKFVAHRKIVTGDYLKRKELDGTYENVDEAIKKGGNITPTNMESSFHKDISNTRDSLSDEDIASKYVELKECYVNVDYNNDGIMEQLIVHCVEDVPIRISKNEYGFIPFYPCCVYYDPNKIFSDRSYEDLIEQQQDLKTAIVKQMIINIARQNVGQKIVDADVVDINALLDGDEIVMASNTDKPVGNYVYALETPQLSAYTMDLLNYCQSEIESQTGSTKYNQGLDSNSLNKMLALDTPIPMADGTFKANGDIVPGDMVIGSDGKPTRVLVAHPVQMPERAFLLTFQNGEQIKAGGEHLWAVKMCDKHYHHMSPDFEKLPTERIFELMQSGHKAFVPRVGKVNFTTKELPLEPYILGLWLGDGNSHTNRFTTMDDEIKDAFEKWSSKFYQGHIKKCKQQHCGKATTYSIVNTPFRRILKHLKCLKDERYEETRHNVKHIPEIYLQGNFEQRLALLQGLMDTDGCIDKNGNAIFCNSEPRLIEDVVKLIESLGGKPNVNWRKGNITNIAKNAKPHAHITFAIPYCPVRIKRKVERWKTRDSKYWEKQAIVKIEEIELEPMRCLTVEAPDALYCCGRRFVVTSNTATGISMIMSAADKRAKMIARDIAENFYVPLIKGIIVLDQMYMRDEEIVRLNDENVAIRREELNIDYDLVINVGEGAGTKEARIQYLMILINQLIPLLVQSGIADDNTIYDSAKELLQEMGLRSSIASLTDPKSPEGIQKKQQAQQAQAEQVQMAQQMEAQKQQTELLKAVLPRVSIKYEDLPIAAQQQLLQAIGLGVDTSEFMAKTLLDGMNERQAGLPSNQDMQPEVEAKKPSEVKSTNDKSKPGIKEGNTRAYYRKGNEK